ncbi:helix-turn-helix transcriptional regulator [Streptomyces sp. PT12]|uniref:helix-turn-helix transcriptional regulator n=1 Tax=Streptomyces sp. PT12 TaxID=1510197 RepID=UPI000DE4DB22|nr:helix-turn-helix transcriptional regulator [Streptomyces sp. PT12]RBM14131.1 DNA-binding protein [Streptomyces sp. PT12]
MQATSSPPVSGLLRRAKLRHFLRTRRARIAPEEVGLVHAERRRTPGLRREEVAALAGVGVSWYTWLEQGRDINVSEGIVNAVSNALRLEDTERAYFYRLTGHNPAPRPERRGRGGDQARMRALVEGWSFNPTYLTDRYGGIQLANSSAHTVFRIAPRGHNCLVKFFTDPATRGKYPDTDQVGRGLVAQFRAQSARFPEDREFGRIAERLGERSPRFAELWDCHQVDEPSQNVRRIALPEAGVVVFDRVVMRVPELPESLMVLYLSPTGAKKPAAPARELADAHAKAR